MGRFWKRNDSRGDSPSVIETEPPVFWPGKNVLHSHAGFVHFQIKVRASDVKPRLNPDILKEFRQEEVKAKDFWNLPGASLYSADPSGLRILRKTEEYRLTVDFEGIKSGAPSQQSDTDKLLDKSAGEEIGSEIFIDGKYADSLGDVTAAFAITCMEKLITSAQIGWVGQDIFSTNIVPHDVDKQYDQLMVTLSKAVEMAARLYLEGVDGETSASRFIAETVAVAEDEIASIRKYREHVLKYIDVIKESKSNRVSSQGQLGDQLQTETWESAGRKSVMDHTTRAIESLIEGKRSSE